MKSLREHGEKYVSFFTNKTLFCTIDHMCYKFWVCDGSLVGEEMDDLYCEHEEADVKISFHINKVQNLSNVVVRAADTGILVVILGNMHHFPAINV